jgi:hypothetical protein
MPFGQRVAYMPPKRRSRIRDLRGELLGGALVLSKAPPRPRRSAARAEASVVRRAASELASGSRSLALADHHETVWVADSPLDMPKRVAPVGPAVLSEA